MSAVFNAATAANVNVLRTTNALFQITQKRVATGKAIFSAADNATKYTMSDRMISRSKSLDAVNSGISTNLSALQSNNRTLDQIKGLLEKMEGMATNAINTAGAVGLTASPTADIGENTNVANAGEGHRLSITSDNGRNFTFNFTGANGSTSWSQVARALNEANIGVTMRFTQVGGANRVVLESTDGKTGFTIDGSSSSQVVANISGGLVSSYDGSYNASRFVNGTSSPSGFGGSNPAGMRFGLGGIVTTASTFAGSSVGAGTSLTFQGADGVARTWSTRTDKNLDVVVQEINALNAGVKAEIVAAGAGTYRISLRNIEGGNMVVLNGTGAFDSAAGAARFNGTAASGPRVEGSPRAGQANVETRLGFGQAYNGARNEIGAYIANNVSPQGRNLLRGDNITIFLNEFSTPGNATDGLTIRGRSLTVNGFHLNMNVDGSTWGGIGNIQNAKEQITAAKERVLQLQAEFGTYTSMVKERLDMNKSFVSDIKALGDEIVAADIGEESATLTALQTQQQFAVQAFSAGSQNSQGLLRLLG